MDIFDFLSMVGGLALFLYGMELLGEGLSRASGGRLESILEKLTSTPIKGVLVGAAVTGVIQSSSATTVMVVGFVNSGVMKLQQAVGIIMGANIGTTVTAWILGTAGIDTSSVWLELLKPTSFSPILAIVGVAILLFSKKDSQKNVATILVGFALLMTGMETMSSAVEPLKDVPEFTNLLLRFSNPILGMLAGLVLTAIIQSSSASVGILQALCATGAVSYSAAIPIIMGQNIGTCVTALLSSIGANKNAKRAAFVHLYFNVVGTVLFMVVFYTVNAFVDFAFMPEAATEFGIAFIHSLFNVITTIVLLPFSKLLVKMACLTIRDEQQPANEQTNEDLQPLQLLDVRFLDTSSLAMEHSRSAAEYMARLAEQSMDLALGLLTEYNEETASRVLQLEDEIDQYEDSLGSYLVKLSAKDLSERDSHTLNTILHCISDFERISDHARNVKKSAQELYDKKLKFSKKAAAEMEVFSSAVRDILKITTESFCLDDHDRAAGVEPMEEVINRLNYEIKQRHIKRLRDGKCTIELGFILTDLSNDFERVADHCSNIAVCLLQVSENEYDTHAYLGQLKTQDNIDFGARVDYLSKQYALPEGKKAEV